MSLVLEPPSVFVRNLMPADLSASAGLHLQAFPNAAISCLGHDAARRYHEFLKHGAFDLVGLGAFDGDKLAGFCFGGPQRDAEGAFLRRNFGFIAGRIGARPWLLARGSFCSQVSRGIRFPLPGSLHRQARLAGTGDGDAPRSFGVLYLAVAPSYQGRGIAKLLLAECENVAAARGFSRMDLAVLPDNFAAVGLYEQMGWQRLVEEDGWRGAMFKPIA